MGLKRNGQGELTCSLILVDRCFNKFTFFTFKISSILELMIIFKNLLINYL